MIQQDWAKFCSIAMREHSNIPGFLTQIKDFRNNVRLNKQVNPKILFNLVFLKIQGVYQIILGVLVLLLVEDLKKKEIWLIIQNFISYR